MPLPSTQPHIRMIFMVSVALVLTVLFLLSVTFREAEFRTLTAIGRFLSATSYRLQYAAVGLWATPITTSAGTADAIPVLLYHGIVGTSDRFSMTPGTFREQMFALKRAGYRTITIDEFIAFQRGEVELPDRSFLLTFDDGRRDSVDGAGPILEALGFTAVMYVATDASLDEPDVHSEYYIDATDIERMLRSGRWEIGSHAEQRGGGLIRIDASDTRGNFLSNRRWLDAEGRLENLDEYRARVDREIRTSEEALGRAFGIQPRSFSYPFGDYGQQSDTMDRATARQVIRDAVASTYAIAFRQVWPLDAEYTYTYPGDDPWLARRIEVGTQWSGAELLSYLARGTPKSIPYADDLSRDAGWKYGWGSVSVSDGALRLNASSTTGALAFLDGTGAWTNYSFSVTATERRGYLSLFAGYRGEDTMVSCTFGDTWVRITEENHGVTRTLIERPLRLSDTALGIVVSGNSITCTERGAIVAEAEARSPIQMGGIGIRIWDEETDVAHVTIDAVSVVPAAETAVTRQQDETTARTTAQSGEQIRDAGSSLASAQAEPRTPPPASDPAPESLPPTTRDQEEDALVHARSEHGTPQWEQSRRDAVDLLRRTERDSEGLVRVRTWLLRSGSNE